MLATINNEIGKVYAVYHAFWKNRSTLTPHDSRRVKQGFQARCKINITQPAHGVEKGDRHEPFFRVFCACCGSEPVPIFHSSFTV